VETAFGSAKVTVPGPLTTLHWRVRMPPRGRPSSVTIPASVAAGTVVVTSGPALTSGAVLARSSFLIVPVACGRARRAPTGDDNVTKNVSSASAVVSPATATSTIRSVVPAGKTTAPVVAV